jgi:hypothetical protein
MKEDLEKVAGARRVTADSVHAAPARRSMRVRRAGGGARGARCGEHGASST